MHTCHTPSDTAPVTLQTLECRRALAVQLQCLQHRNIRSPKRRRLLAPPLAYSTSSLFRNCVGLLARPLTDSELSVGPGVPGEPTIWTAALPGADRRRPNYVDAVPPTELVLRI